MEKVFLDSNIFIDIIEKRSNVSMLNLGNQILYISPLSIHILAYVYKYTVPERKLKGIEKYFNLVSFDLLLTLKSLNGPTNDFEDNIQLHSAAEAECDIFLTEDKKLLSLAFFGKTKIASTLPSSN